MCNLLSKTKTQDAMRSLFRVTKDRTGNLPPMAAVFPDCPAPIIRRADGERELATAPRLIPLAIAVGLLASVTLASAQAPDGSHTGHSAPPGASVAPPVAQPRANPDASMRRRAPLKDHVRVIRTRAAPKKAQASSSDDTTLGGANIVIPLPPGYVPPPRPARAVAAPPSPARGSAPTRAATSDPSYGVVEIEPDRNGQYQTDMEIDGTPVRALVDTGATFVALTAKDARQLDIDPPPSAFNISARTANGTARVAHVRLRKISIGDITVDNVDAVVAQPGALRISLLGMSFLRQLSGFQVDEGRFVMKQ
jgi:aspartyl protease family protein